MLHFARWIAFGVDIGNLLEFERAFQGDGIIDAAAEIEKIMAVHELARELFDFIFDLQRLFDPAWQMHQIAQQVFLPRRI